MHPLNASELRIAIHCDQVRRTHNPPVVGSIPTRPTCVNVPRRSPWKIKGLHKGLH